MRVFVVVSVVIALGMITVGLLANRGQNESLRSESGALSGSSSNQDVTADSEHEEVARVTESPVALDDDLALSDERCFAGDRTGESPVSGKMIVVDPGHGGEDLGTVNNAFGFNETDFVLRISIDLKDRLVDSGADVCLTRVEDDFIELIDRAEFANEMGGDAFLSIHLNSLPDPSQNYAMTMWGDEAKDRFLAETMLEPLRYKLATPQFHFGEPNPMNPEVYRLEDLDSSMLRSAEMPATLVEASFLSNTWEAQAFASGLDDGTRWRELQIADVLHEGVVNFFDAFE